jgi:hypothetical protein
VFLRLRRDEAPGWIEDGNEWLASETSTDAVADVAGGASND